MPSVAEELQALRNQGLTKKNSSKLKDASGLSTPEKEEISIKEEQEHLRNSNYGKEADTNLKSYNEAKMVVEGGSVRSSSSLSSSVSSTTKSTEVAAPETTKVITTIHSADGADNNNGNGLEEIDADVPVLEEIPDFEEMPSGTRIGNGTGTKTETAGDITNAATVAAETPREINRAERKARRMMEKLSMKKFSGIKQCVLKMRNGAGGARGGAFTITEPDCYNNGSSYIIFGEARQGGPQGGAGEATAGPQQAEAIQQLDALANQSGDTGAGDATSDGGAGATSAAAAADGSLLKIEELDDEEQEIIDDSGVDEKDIDLVISQAGCSRSRAVKALKENDNDLVNAIMSMTA